MSQDNLKEKAERIVYLLTQISIIMDKSEDKKVSADIIEQALHQEREETIEEVLRISANHECPGSPCCWDEVVSKIREMK